MCKGRLEELSCDGLVDGVEEPVAEFLNVPVIDFDEELADNDDVEVGEVLM